MYPTRPTSYKLYDSTVPFSLTAAPVDKIFGVARLTTEKRDLLKKAFTEDAMMPGEAAQKVGVTYATAKRYYEKWSDEIKRSLESKLVPNIEESIKRLGKKRKARLRTGQVPPRTGSKR